ncbi:MAG: hypothetical protein QXW79_01685 [Thermoplasmata archaeon]
MSAYYNSILPSKDILPIRMHLRNNIYFGTNVHPYELIFIKDTWSINNNKDVDVFTDNHNKNFDRFSDVYAIYPRIPAEPKIFDHPILPPDFDWRAYLEINKDVGFVYNDEKGAIDHWLNHGFNEGRSYKYQ